MKTLLLFNRHILASLHFNENVKRQAKTSDDGQEYFRVTYPKYKLGEEVVRKVVVPPTYGKLHVVKFNVLTGWAWYLHVVKLIHHYLHKHRNKIAHKD